MPAPLVVFADVSLLAADGDEIVLTAAQSVITVTLPRLWSHSGAFGPLYDRSQRGRLLASLHRGLQHADLTLLVRVRRQVVAQLRPQSQPTLLSRLLGLGALEVRVIPCLRALVRGQLQEQEG